MEIDSPRHFLAPLAGVDEDDLAAAGLAFPGKKLGSALQQTTAGDSRTISSKRHGPWNRTSDGSQLTLATCVDSSVGRSYHGLARRPLPPLLPPCVCALATVLLPVLPVVELLPVLLASLAALLFIGLAAADEEALDDISEWPVLFANTFLFRSSSAFRSASCTHTHNQPAQRTETQTPHISWVLCYCGCGAVAVSVSCRVVMCCELTFLCLSLIGLSRKKAPKVAARLMWLGYLRPSRFATSAVK